MCKHTHTLTQKQPRLEAFHYSSIPYVWLSAKNPDLRPESGLNLKDEEGKAEKWSGGLSRKRKGTLLETVSSSRTLTFVTVHQRGNIIYDITSLRFETWKMKNNVKSENLIHKCHPDEDRAGSWTRKQALICNCFAHKKGNGKYLCSWH